MPMLDCPLLAHRKKKRKKNSNLEFSSSLTVDGIIQVWNSSFEYKPLLLYICFCANKAKYMLFTGIAFVGGGGEFIKALSTAIYELSVLCFSCCTHLVNFFCQLVQDCGQAMLDGCCSISLGCCLRRKLSVPTDPFVPKILLEFLFLSDSSLLFLNTRWRTQVERRTGTSPNHIRNAQRSRH